MEKLLQVVIAATLCLASCLAEEPYCALRVRLHNPDGRLRSGMVYVVDSNGQRMEKMTEMGDAAFCDLGLGPVTVIVGGSQSCNRTEIHRVALQWQKPYQLLVYFDPVRCQIGGPEIQRFCQGLVRVTEDEEERRWIADAEVSDVATRLVRKTDGYGRAYFTIPAGSNRSLTVRASGFRAEAIDLRCKAEEVIERVVVLVRE